MENIHGHHTLNPCVKPYIPDQSSNDFVNDTVDCFTFPEIDVINDSSSWMSNAPSLAAPVHEPGDHHVPYIVEKEDKNSCHIFSRSSLNNRIRDMTRECFDAHCRKSDPIYNNQLCCKILTSNNELPNESNSNMSGKPSPLDGHDSLEPTISVFNPTEENIDWSNATKENIPTKESKKTVSTNPYSKYVTDPPKSPKMCPPSKRKLTSRAETSQSDNAESPVSSIYVTRGPGQLYEVRFTANNITLSPLYIDKRYETSVENEKKVQPNHVEYADYLRGTDVAVHIVRQKYALSHEESRQKQKTMVPPIRVYTEEPVTTRKRPTSEPPKHPTVGRINLVYKNIQLRIRVPVFPISRMKLPVSEDIIKQMNQLGMPTSESRKNKATVVVRCDMDLLQFKFDMEDITVNSVELRGSAGVQTEDKMVYIRERSLITGRWLLLALPESTYFYQDPMVNIHRLNSNFRHTNVVPLWKYELMRARLADRQGSTQFEEKLNKIFQQTRGSRFFFEGLDSLITAETGLLCCEVTVGQNSYNDLMLEFQGQKPQRKRMPQFLHSKSGQASEQADTPKQTSAPASQETENADAEEQ